MNTPTTDVKIPASAHLAGLLEYPSDDLQTRSEQAMAMIGPGAILQAVSSFASAARKISLEELQEIYIQTFEITPSCVPYLTIHLFGEENFKRGELMAKLRGRYDELQFDCGHELPDHLAVLLRFIAIVEPNEAQDLLCFVVLAPLRKMIASLDPANLYHPLLLAVQMELQRQFPGAEAELTPLEQSLRNGPLSCASISPSCHCGVQPSKGPGEELLLQPNPMP